MVNPFSSSPPVKLASIESNLKNLEVSSVDKTSLNESRNIPDTKNILRVRELNSNGLVLESISQQTSIADLEKAHSADELVLKVIGEDGTVTFKIGEKLSQRLSHAHVDTVVLQDEVGQSVVIPNAKFGILTEQEKGAINTAVKAHIAWLQVYQKQTSEVDEKSKVDDSNALDRASSRDPISNKTQGKGHNKALKKQGLDPIINSILRSLALKGIFKALAEKKAEERHELNKRAVSQDIARWATLQDIVADAVKKLDFKNRELPARLNRKTSLHLDQISKVLKRFKAIKKENVKILLDKYPFQLFRRESSSVSQSDRHISKVTWLDMSNKSTLAMHR